MSKHFGWVVVLAVLWGLGLGLAARPAQAFSNPNDFCTGDPCIINADRVVDAVVGGVTLDFGARTVILQKQLTIANLPSGAVGALTLKAGTFQITGSGFVKGSNSSGPAGSVTIDVVNNILLNGTTSLGDFRLAGQDGGSLSLKTVTGSITGAGRINVNADGAIASGGTLDLLSGADINLTGNINILGSTQGSGGSIDIESVGNASVTGFLDISGGQGGGGFLDATVGGSLTLGVIDMSGSGEDADAAIVIIDVTGNVNFNGKITGRGSDISESCGDGADIDVTAGGSITIAADMDIKGRGLDCTGGSLALDADSVFLQSLLEMTGTGTQGDGGDLDVEAVTLIRQTGNVQLDGGDSGGGDLFYLCDNAVEITGNINANGRSPNSPGSALFEVDASMLTVSGDINASGGVNATGGDVAFSACDVIFTSTADITSLGQQGVIAISASDTAQLHGHFTAASDGGTTIEVNSKSNPPNVSGAVFSPAATIVLNPAFLPCRACENNAQCADTNDCTDDVCVPSTGCTHTPRNSGSCSDGNQCTTGDQCAAGVCVGGPVNPCNDNNQCTLDACVPATGCTHSLQMGSCDDGNLCTTGDNCSSGSCVGTPLNCGDANPCTNDVCTAGVCSNPPNTNPCNDGNACTTGDVCSGGACAGTPLNCSDTNPCTNDVCTAGVCSHPPNSNPCNDGNACTSGDVCSGGACAGTPLNCGDGNPCTNDVCTAGVCSNPPNTNSCNDGDACTINDACSAGTCVGGPPRNCNDANVCTTDSCDMTSGCQHAAIGGCVDTDNDGTVDDQDECTTIVWTPFPTTPPNQNPLKFALIATKLSALDGEQHVLIKGRFNVATSTPAIDPTTNGVQVHAADALGTLFDVSVPGGSGCGPNDGWTTVGTGANQTWKYLNKSGALPPGCLPGSAAGVASIQIKDGRLSNKQALQLKVNAKTAGLLRDPILPLTRIQVSVALAARPSPGTVSTQAKIGQCAEALFTGNPISSTGKPFCKPKLKGALLDGTICKGL